MIQKDVFVLNTTNEPQVLRHSVLVQMVVVPVMPGGYVLTRNDSVVIPAGAAFRVPMRIWNTGACAYKRAWTKEITEAEFVRRAVSEDDPAAEIITGLEARIAELEEAVAQLSTPEAGASTVGAPAEPQAADAAPEQKAEAQAEAKPEEEAEPAQPEPAKEAVQPKEEAADDPQGQFKCPTCDRTFAQRANLARHIPSCKGRK
ncbi:MAG: C2H2-type zinc finger protein [Armatimonadota bacterium]